MPNHGDWQFGIYLDGLNDVRPDLPDDVKQVQIQKHSADNIPIAFYGVSWPEGIDNAHDLIERHLRNLHAYGADVSSGVATEAGTDPLPQRRRPADLNPVSGLAPIGAPMAVSGLGSAATAFLADRLGRHEMPRILAFRAELPKTPVGKYSRKLLRDQELGKDA